MALMTTCLGEKKSVSEKEWRREIYQELKLYVVDLRLLKQMVLKLFLNHGPIWEFDKSERPLPQVKYTKLLM